jgi:hypothetical protein
MNRRIFRCSLRTSLLLLFFTSLTWAQLNVVIAPGTVISVNGTVVTLVVQLNFSGGGHTASVPVAPGTSVNVTFTDTTGATTTKAFTVGADGDLTIPGGSFPGTSTVQGCQVGFSYLGITSDPIKWKAADYLWQSFGSAYVDPIGLPGFTSPQSWFIDQSGVATTSPFSLESSLVTSSNFDLAYTNLGGGLFSAAITGDDSYMTLADGTFIFFPAGTQIGDLDYLFDDGTTADGTFDFTGLGLSGTFEWAAGSNYASATATDFTNFSAPAAGVATPEPRMTGVTALALLIFCGMVFRLSRRLCRLSNKPAEPTLSR